MRYALIRLAASLILMCSLVIAGAMLVGALLPTEGQIAYSSALDGDMDIYLLDIGRGMRLNLTRSLSNEYQPAWSPDGLRIAYASDVNGGRDIYMQAVGCVGLFTGCGGGAERLTTSNANDFSPAWSPDGRYIAYVSESFEDMEIAVIDLVSGDPTPIRLTNHIGLDGDPSWSPDGRQIAFVSDRDSPFDSDFYVMDAGCIPAPDTCEAGIRPLLVALDNQLQPVWSPDGGRIVFTTTQNVLRQMAILDVGGDDEPRLLLTGQDGDDTPGWSADGQSIIFVSYREAQSFDVYLLRLDCVGGCVQRLTYDEAFALSPRWRPGT